MVVDAVARSSPTAARAFCIRLFRVEDRFPHPLRSNGFRLASVLRELRPALTAISGEELAVMCSSIIASHLILIVSA